MLIVGAVLYFSGVMGPRTAEDGGIDADINIEQPEAPDVDVQIERPDIEVPDTITIVD